MIILIISLFLALIIAIFALQNAAQVTIQFLWFLWDVPLVLVILGAAFLGALVMFLLALWREIRIKRKEKTLQDIGIQEDKPVDIKGLNTEKKEEN